MVVEVAAVKFFFLGGELALESVRNWTPPLVFVFDCADLNEQADAGCSPCTMAAC